MLKLSQFYLICICLVMPFSTLQAEDKQAPAKMDSTRIQTLLSRLDKNVEGEKGFWQLEIAGVAVTVITDDKANRMRVISPVSSISGVEPKSLYRMMQANFDSALDARYSIAKGVIWSAFIHPLEQLSDQQFLEGVGQVVNLVTSYGSTYSSGLLVFGGGDSGKLQRELIDDLLEKGLAI